MALPKTRCSAWRPASTRAASIRSPQPSRSKISSVRCAQQIARLPVDLDIASEFRYREAPLDPGELAIFVSQSGETADTLAALRYCREAGQKIIAIVNQPESTIAREADIVLPTLAGPEIGVASTKAFTTQLIVLLNTAIAAGRARDTLSR